MQVLVKAGCFRYHKGTDFQANHNSLYLIIRSRVVVLDTTKVQIFKQITTDLLVNTHFFELFQIPQRYRFSSKSQLVASSDYRQGRCFRYHKGTDFQANHNNILQLCILQELFQIPQRYRFSSKSQPFSSLISIFFSCFRYHKGTDFQANHNKKLCHVYKKCCFRYHKGTDFQANHNSASFAEQFFEVVLDTTKVQIFKQITTRRFPSSVCSLLFQIPQRYRFSSKSQQRWP